MTIRCIFGLLELGSALLLWPGNKLAESATPEVIRGARTACLRVEEVYPRADGVHLPFAELTRALFGYAGVAVTSDATSCDIDTCSV